MVARGIQHDHDGRVGGKAWASSSRKVMKAPYPCAH
jgi:hypothetical protein